MLARGCVVLLCLSVTLGQRVYFHIGTHLLDPFAVGFVVLAVILWVRDSLEGPGRRPYRALTLNTVGPLLALLIVLPALGILLQWYAIPELYALILPALIAATLSLARAQRLHGLRLDRLGFALILTHGLYGLGQTLYRLHLIPASLWSWAFDWDARSQLALNEAYLITNRSTGLFINANLFGMWSVLAILFAVTFLRGRAQAVSVILGVVGVVGSQSRTAWVGMGALAIIGLVRALRNPRVADKAVRWTPPVAAVALVAWMLGWLPRLIEAQLVTRLVSGADVVGGGVGADTNLAGRVDAWGRAWAFSTDYPFGTLGSPEALFHSFIDNQFVALFLQGSVPLVAAFVFALFSPLVLARRGVPHAAALGLVSALVALFSLTMLPLDSFGAAALVWLMAAASVGSAQHSEVRGDDHDAVGAVAART